MEEDIKILEDMITWDCLLPNKRQTQALENLIKGYRELQKETDKLLSQNEWYKDYYDCDSIPKSKIRKALQDIENEYISIGKNKGDKFIHVMLGLRFAMDRISELMEE